VVEERKVIDTSPAAITLAPLLTGEELDSLGRGAGDGEEGAGVRVVIDVQAPAAGQAAAPTLHEAVFSGKKHIVCTRPGWR
jgi:hypothetical protein